MKKLLLLSLFLFSCAGEQSPNKVANATPAIAPVFDTTLNDWVIRFYTGVTFNTGRTMQVRQLCNFGLASLRDESITLSLFDANAVAGMGCGGVANVQYFVHNNGNEAVRIMIFKNEVLLSVEEMGGVGPILFIQPGQDFYFKYNL